MAFDPTKYKSADVRQLAIDLLDNFTSGGLVLGAGNNHVGQVGGTTLVNNDSFNRPANTDGYIANDIISNSTSAAAALEFRNVIRTEGGSGYITRVKLTTDKVSITPSLRIHFFGKEANVFSNILDNTPMNATQSELENFYYIGYVDLPALSSAGSSGASFAQEATVRLPFNCEASASTSIFGVIQTLSAFTPNSGQNFAVSIATECN